MRCLALLIVMFIAGRTDAQDTDTDNEIEKEKAYFSEQVAVVRHEYISKAKKALKKGKSKHARQHFKNFIKDELVGTYMDNFDVSCLNTNKCCINDYSKPMILITYASWCVPGKGEIPAINHLADKEKEEIDIVVLFWDDRRSARKAAKDLNNDVHVVYVDELKNRYIHTIRMLKHSIGFPKVFSIASDKRILQIRTTKALPFHKKIDKAFEENLAFFEDLISDIRDYEKTIKQTDTKD